MAASDPTAGFTDMQWYMLNQRNVAFFAAWSSGVFNEDDLLVAARGLVELAPQLRVGFPGGTLDKPIPDDLLRRIIHSERVDTLAGFPDRWLDDGRAVFSDPALPLFRIRYAAASSPPADGPQGFLLVQVSHALVEGADSALLTRSQSAAHPHVASETKTSPLVRVAAIALGGVLVGLHVLVGNLVTVRPGPFRFATRTYPRSLFTELARRYDVRQRALFFALAMHTLFGAGTADGKARISSTYSVIDEGGGADRDSFMRMRMRFASFANTADLTSYIRAVDAQLARSEARESGFNDRMNAQGIRLHRKLSKLVPAAYTPKLFQFMPYDIVLGLIPPHRLGGRLTAGLIEPVYAGAALDGANACVIVPNRRQVTFNFYIQEKLLPRVAGLDAALAASLISHSGTGV